MKNINLLALNLRNINLRNISIPAINFREQGVLGIFVTLIALIAFTSFYAFYQWHSDWALAHQTITATQVTKSDKTADMITAIENTHLFGQSFSKGNVPISSLQMRVTGIVKSENEQSGTFSKAYISMSGQPSKIYQIGDALPYGVKVYDITPDTVILENDGHLEKLPLPRQPLEFKARNTEPKETDSEESE